MVTKYLKKIFNHRESNFSENMQKWLSLFIIRQVFLEEEVDKPRSSMDLPLANIDVVKFVVDILLTFFLLKQRHLML